MVISEVGTEKKEKEKKYIYIYTLYSRISSVLWESGEVKGEKVVSFFLILF